MTNRTIPCPECGGFKVRWADFGNMNMPCEACKQTGTIADRRAEVARQCKECESLAEANLKFARENAGFRSEVATMSAQLQANDVWATKMVEDWDKKVAEVARLQAEKLALDERCCEVQECFDALQETSSDEIAALKAKLARYEADLTETQAAIACDDLAVSDRGHTPESLMDADAAIRKVRGEP